LALAALGGLTCSEPSGPGRVQLTLAIASAAYVPGDVLSGTIDLNPRGRTINWLGVSVTGYIVERDSVPIGDSDPATYGFDVQLPFQPPSGTLSFVAFARSGSAYDTSTAVSVTVADMTPPSFDVATARPLSPQADQVLRAVFRARDNAGLVRIVVAWSGALSGADTFALTGYPRQHDDSVPRRIPRGASPGRTVTLAITTTDLAGLASTQTLGPYTLIDSTPPTVTATTNAPASAEPLLPGDTLRVTVNAADNHRLAYVGWVAGPPASARDSAAATDTVATGVSLTRVVPLAWVGNQSLQAFARDSMGNQQNSLSLPGLFVIDAIRRPLQAGALVDPAAIRDLVVDERRNVAYVATASGGQGMWGVAILSLATLSYSGSIAVPFLPAGIDLTPSGDTLVIALSGSPYLGIVDLTAASPVVDTLRLTFDAGDGRSPDQVRVAANGRAVVLVAADSADHIPGLGRVVEVNLATGASAVRADAGSAGAVSSRPRLARSLDHSKVFVFYRNTCCTFAGQVYDAASNTFLAPVGTAGYFDNHHFSADSSGNRLLVRTTLYDGSLTILGSVFATGFTNGASALSDDGTVAHFGNDGGVPSSFATYQVPAGTRVERVLLPGPAARLWTLRDGQWLLGVIGGYFTLVDLR
jgi:hypothetical protein